MKVAIPLKGIFDFCFGYLMLYIKKIKSDILVSGLALFLR